MTSRGIRGSFTAAALLVVSLTGTSYATPRSETFAPVLESALHAPLPEQYLTVSAPDPWRLQRTFDIAALPRNATLYIATDANGSRAKGAAVTASLNGRAVFATPPPPHGGLYVFVHDVTAALRRGPNTLVVQTTGAGRVAIKIVPAPENVMAPALVISDARWKANGAVTSGGPIESYPYLLGNHDAGMYRWVGYDGISSYLTRRRVEPVKTFADALDPSRTVLDFGREYAGRAYVVSRALEPLHMTVAYGESLEEAERGPYLGVETLTVPANGTAYASKSAFRYMVIGYPPGQPSVKALHVSLDAILYPVKYYGSFASSDPLLNRIWSVGAYTVLLCMQDTIWDAPKRDREPWIGDLNVSGLVIDDVFADRFLMRKTLDVLIDGAGRPVHQDVNGIPGYSAFWVMDLTDYYRHTGDRAFVMSKHDQLVQLLSYMQRETTANAFTDPYKSWAFVDWSPQYDGYSPQAQAATDFEFIKAFTDAAWLLKQEGDATNAQRYTALVAAMRADARSQFFDPSVNAYGSRWQGNAFAMLSGVAEPSQYTGIWNNVLSKPSGFIITPYYNYYVISAMAMDDQRKAALAWIRIYWGGMVRDGATTFWEHDDPRWPKRDFDGYHQSGRDYSNSLSHGWSAGPTAWLMLQILGIRPERAGFARTAIRPDLAGLAWARGTEPTPHGIIHVGYRGGRVFTAQIQLPAGVIADVSMPVKTSVAVAVNGHPAPSEPSEHGKRRVVVLTHAGTYTLTSR